MRRHINERLGVTVIEGQAGCDDDCQREVWVGDNGWDHFWNNACDKEIHKDAVFSIKF